MDRPFRKHVQVLLRSDIASDTLQALAPQFVPDTLYMVFAVVEHTDGSGDTLWLGPAESDWNLVENFDPEQSRDRKTKGVYPVAAVYMRRIG